MICRVRDGPAVTEPRTDPDILGCAPRLQHRIERISQLPRTKQRFVIEMLYTMRARASR